MRLSAAETEVLKFVPTSFLAYRANRTPTCWPPREVARLQLDSVKLHNLYAVKDTPLAEQVSRGEVRLLERDEYIKILIDFLELLPPETIVERISGDAPPDYFVGPAWCLDKPALRAAVDNALKRRETWQGKRFVEPKTVMHPAITQR